MVDDVDRANALAAEETASGVQAAREAAAKIPEGKPGECDLCGEWSGRLVNGACAPCRDRYNVRD